jgi:glutamate 5-kinase
MVKADYLFLMTDVDCLYSDNPRTNPDAAPVKVCDDIEGLRERITVTAPGSSLGTGGMVTKLIAADLATAAGVTTIITRGSKPDNITKIISDSANAPLHTRFVAKKTPLMDRKWWILHGLHTAGTLFVEESAAKDIAGRQGGSLTAASIVKVSGSFVSNQSARIVVERMNSDGEMELVTIAKGIVNYSSQEIERIMRCDANEISKILGYEDSDSVVHRDNMAIAI